MGGAGGQQRIELIVFDLGRVLVRICNDWVHACNTAGVQIALDKLDPSSLLQLRELVHQVEVNAVSFEEFARRVGEALGTTPEQIRCASEAFLVSLYPGAVELIAELHKVGVATACLSNTNEHHWELLADPNHSAFGGLSELKYLFASHTIGSRKPEPGIYEHLERETGFRGDAILFFDDVKENVQAARSRGWNAEWVDPELDDPLPQIRAALLKHGVFS